MFPNVSTLNGFFVSGVFPASILNGAGFLGASINFILEGSKYESIFARGLIGQIMLYGILHGVFTIISFILGVQIAISTGAPLLRFNYGIITTFLTLSIGGVLKSIVMCSSNVIWKQKFSECKWIYLSSLISIFLSVAI